MIEAIGCPALNGYSGLQTDRAESGLRALDQLKAAQRHGSPYDLAILDMKMPEMTGLELAHRIKVEPTLVATQLILMLPVGQRGSGESGKIFPNIALALTKPIRQAQLYGGIVTALDASTELSLQTRRQQPLIAHQTQIYAKVLLAEDSVINQKVAVRMLEKLGCRIDTVANGREAVEAISNIVYDLVFMDCRMPEMDGYDATVAIRAREAVSGDRTPIIALTANAMREDRERCLQAGMDDYISKPVTTEKLHAILLKWIKASAGTPSAPPTVHHDHLSTSHSTTEKGL